MKLIVLLSCLSIVQAEVNSDNFEINGVRHYRETLFENLPERYIFNTFLYSSVAVDYSSNILYIPTYDKTAFAPAIFNISSRELTNITDIPSESSSVTVDQDTHDIYIGTKNGIYKYNQSTHKHELISAKDLDVWRVYFKKVLYYNTWRTTEIRTVINGTSRIFDTVDFHWIRNFVIVDEDHFVYVSQNRELFSHKRGTKHDILYKGITYVKSLTTDMYGKIYASADEGIYEVVTETSLKRFVAVDDAEEIAFDNQNNLVYCSHNESKIYRLKPVTETINATDHITNSNVTDQHTHNNAEATSYNFIKTKLENIDIKIDHLTQIINKLTNIVDKQPPRAETFPQTMHLNDIGLKNINISLNMAIAGVGKTDLKPAG